MQTLGGKNGNIKVGRSLIDELSKVGGGNDDMSDEDIPKQKKTRGKSANPAENHAARQTLDCIEHRIRQHKYDNLPAHHYEFSMTTLQLDFPELAALAIKCFRKNAPDTKLFDNEIFIRLQVTQDNRLQLIVKKDFMIDETSDPMLFEPPAGRKGVSKDSKKKLAELQR
jgi:hypothetical protein